MCNTRNREKKPSYISFSPSLSLSLLPNINPLGIFRVNKNEINATFWQSSEKKERERDGDRDKEGTVYTTRATLTTHRALVPQNRVTRLENDRGGDDDVVKPGARRNVSPTGAFSVGFPPFLLGAGETRVGPFSASVRREKKSTEFTPRSTEQPRGF